MSDTVRVQDNGDWVEITLNRPDRLNSFNDEMHEALRDALLNSQGKRAILLTGAGRGFCAGQDLGDRDPSKMDGPPDLEHTIKTFYAPLIKLIKDTPAPIVCAVNGVAAGAGANIALACDMVFAAESARFIQSFAKVGLVPDAGGTWMLPRLIGEARAKAITLTATPVSASQAQDWGMIWRAVADDALMETARAQTITFAQGPTFGLAQTKALLHSAMTTPLAAQLDLEAAAQGSCGRSDDYAEGVTAFLGKRAPSYRGS